MRTCNKCYKKFKANGNSRKCLDCPYIRKKDNISIREKYLMRTYGISEADYYYMLAVQKGVCAICKNYNELLCVDHDHKTGAVRGLLCTPCNQGIGFLQDSISILESAKQYLQNNISS